MSPDTGDFLMFELFAEEANARLASLQAAATRVAAGERAGQTAWLADSPDIRGAAVCAELRALALVLDATERAAAAGLLTHAMTAQALDWLEESLVCAPSTLAAWDAARESDAETFAETVLAVVAAPPGTSSAHAGSAQVGPARQPAQPEPEPQADNDPVPLDFVDARPATGTGILPVVRALTPSAQGIPHERSERTNPRLTAITGERHAIVDPESGVDAEMLGLFREELSTHLFTMSDGLTALDGDPAAGDRLVAVMRAAHSIKGALRILGLDSVVTLAHVAEDRVQSAIRGGPELTAHEIDALLRACDLFEQLVQVENPHVWVLTVHDHIAALTRRVQRGPQTETDEPLVQPPSSAAEEFAPASRGEVPRNDEQESRPDAGPSSARITESGTAAAPAPAAEGQRSVKVTALHLDRLLGLAGEGMTDARRLAPLARSLHQLSLQQSELIGLLGELRMALGPEIVGTPADAVLQRLRARAEDIRTHIRQRHDEADDFARRNDELTRRLYRETIESRMRPFRDGVQWFPRLVRDLSRKLGRPTDFRMIGEDVRVDRDVLDKIEAPLNHLLRNALDHGIETPEERMRAGKPERATLTLEARPWAGMLSVTVSDDGRGVDVLRVREKIVERGLAEPYEVATFSESQVLDHLFAPGFSTRDRVTELSGRGVGLDVVQTAVHEVGGSVRVQTQPGQGTSFQLLLPITLSVTRAVVVTIDGEPFAIPLVRVHRLLRVSREEIIEVSGRPCVLCDGERVGLVDASDVLGLGRTAAGPWISVVVLRSYLGAFGLRVDAITGEQDLVVRPLDPRLGRVADVLAAAVLPDGEPVLILDAEDLVRSVIRMLERSRPQLGNTRTGDRPAPRILLVDDSITVREVERQTLLSVGYRVTVAVDGADAWQTVREQAFDLVITDVDMPRMDGLELTRSIRGDVRFRDIPVVVVSYRDRPEDRVRAAEAGATRYLAKSEFQEDTLLAIVRELVGVPG
jgi:two-component system sensor histidine kinase and response regulator WspE